MYVSIQTICVYAIVCPTLFILLQVPLSNLQSGGSNFRLQRENQLQQNVTEDLGPSITLPPSLFTNLTSPRVGVFFTYYPTAVFFPLAQGTHSDIIIGTPVIGASVANVTVRELEENVTVVFQLQNTVSALYVCVMALI